MTTSEISDRSRVGSLLIRLFGLAFIDEFGPLYAVYTLWFNDHGISTAQVSTLFLVWALVSLVLEIPSGALADRVDRRYLLGVAFVIRAAGIVLWLVWPTLPGVFLGVILWATHDALASGSWEALIHDELSAVGAASRYGPVMARIGQFSNLGIATGTMLGAALLRVDVDLVVLGWLTVAAHFGSVALVIRLPDARAALARAGDEGEPEPDAGPGSGAGSALGQWWATLRSGLAEARTVPVLSRLVVLGAFLEGLFLIDEYLPLLSRARGGSDGAAPVIVFVVWVGLLLGGEVAARRPSLTGPVLGSSLVVGMGVTMLAFVGDAVWALAAIAVGYAALETVWITTDARLQERTSGPTRATVTSVRGFGSACVSMVMLAVIGALSVGDDPTPGLLVVVAGLAAVGVLVIRWLPPSPSGERCRQASESP